MTDSVDRKESGEFTPEVRARLAKYDKKNYTEFADLPAHVRTACAMHELMGMSWKEIAERLGKAESTVDKYKRYPAYKAWREELQEASQDPSTMAQMALKSSALGITLEYLAAFEKSIAAGDYNTTHKMAKDLLDRAGVIAKKSNEGAISVKIQMGGTSAGLLESPSVEAEWELVHDAEDDDDA